MTIPTDPHLLYQDWLLTETQFIPDQLNYKETVFTIGNGYLGTRGSLEEGYPGSNSVTLINGVYLMAFTMMSPFSLRNSPTVLTGCL
jgi:trehalose/maltose hydrolase-like predicted phosphorylase